MQRASMRGAVPHRRGHAAAKHAAACRPAQGPAPSADGGNDETQPSAVGEYPVAKPSYGRRKRRPLDTARCRYGTARFRAPRALWRAVSARSALAPRSVRRAGARACGGRGGDRYRVGTVSGVGAWAPPAARARFARAPCLRYAWLRRGRRWRRAAPLAPRSLPLLSLGDSAAAGSTSLTWTAADGSPVSAGTGAASGGRWIQHGAGTEPRDSVLPARCGAP